MKTLFALPILLAALTATAQTKQVYEGTSPVSYNDKNACKVTLTLNQQKQIIAVDTYGPAKQWEILSENQDGYGPSSSVVLETNDELLSDVASFAKLGFVRSSHFFSDGFTLKSNNSVEGALRAKFQLEFKMNGSQFLALKKNTKFKASVVTLASKELICENLKKVSR